MAEPQAINIRPADTGFSSQQALLSGTVSGVIPKPDCASTVR